MTYPSQAPHRLQIARDSAMAVCRLASSSLLALAGVTLPNPRFRRMRVMRRRHFLIESGTSSIGPKSARKISSTGVGVGGSFDGLMAYVRLPTVTKAQLDHERNHNRKSDLNTRFPRTLFPTPAPRVGEDASAAVTPRGGAEGVVDMRPPRPTHSRPQRQFDSDARENRSFSNAGRRESQSPNVACVALFFRQSGLLLPLLSRDHS